MDRYLRFIFFVILGTALLLGLAAWFNFMVDPFQQYRLAKPEHVRFPRALQRYINPGLAKNADYDFVITGSSMMENYDCWKWGKCVTPNLLTFPFLQ